MSSEAITQNDLREILSRTVGSIPSEYKKLLWTNASPTSDFTAQTISIDLSDYDEVEVWFNCWRNRPNTSLQFRVKKGTYGIATQGASTNTSSGINPFVVGSYIIVQDRPIYVTDTGVQFGTCTEGASNGTMYNANGSMIPAYIYGIKYERVAPPQMEVPMVAYNENFVGSSGTINKTHTIADNGLYLILARANATSGSAVPAVRIYINNVIQAQNADAGGSTMTYHLATLSAGDIVKGEFSATNAESTQSSWNNLAIIRLGSTS